jgi:hypothetical protein
MASMRWAAAAAAALALVVGGVAMADNTSANTSDEHFDQYEC